MEIGIISTTKKIVLAVLLTAGVIVAEAQPKREFRGAWIQCVNGQWLGMSTEKMQQTLRFQLDELKKLQTQVADSARELEDSVRKEYQTARSAIETPVQNAVGDIEAATRSSPASGAATEITGKPVL